MSDTLSRLLFDPTVSRLLAAAAGLLLVVVLTRFVSRRVTPHIADVDDRYRVRKLFTFGGYLLGAFVVLTVYSDRLGSFGVAFGVAGAGVAFALQEVIASVAGWASITFGGTFRVGDRVQLGGITGDVIDIGVLRSTLMEVGGWVDGDLYNGRIVKVGNSFVFKEPIRNYTADFPFLWDEIKVPIRHGSDIEFTRGLMDRAAADLVGDYARGAEEGWKRVVNVYRIEDARVTPSVTLTANENWMVFTLRYAVDYRQRRSTKDRLWTRIIGEIQASGDRSAIAYSTLHLSSEVLRVQSVPAGER